ncbi:MAG: coenzyme F420-0:L-glutamate ligase [Propionibacteriales bacterium]|nr:coenzyme F420-0:L-glutamate ligase [Propionibacteriales bacterium]
MTRSASTPNRIEISSYDWPEVTAGTDLVALVTRTLELADGDVLVLTSKVVSKAEDRVVPGPRATVVAAESTRTVARRGQSVITETRHGLIMAAAGVDASNVGEDCVATLPVDSDDSARRLRAGLYDVTGRNVAVVVTDTAGRAWRNGQTDMAIGCAGLWPLVDLAGTLDVYSGLLTVTAPAVADELAAAADLVKGKTTGRPLARVRGLGDTVLPVGAPGPGAGTLIRHRDDDLFGLGARDAVQAAALRSDEQALGHFPRRVGTDPEPFEGVDSDSPDVLITWARSEQTVDDTPGGAGDWLVQVDVRSTAGPDAWIEAGRLLERVDILAAAHRLRLAANPGPLPQVTGWRTVARGRWSVA